MARYGKPFKFIPKNPQKYIGDVDKIIMRSTWERKFAIWCDLNPSVIAWNSEGIPIPYFHKVNGKIHNYYVDFFVKLTTKNGEIKKLAVEVKPKCETEPPKVPKRKTQKSQQNYLTECLNYQRNKDKWESAQEWCKKNGFEFVILTEYELGIKK